MTMARHGTGDGSEPSEPVNAGLDVCDRSNECICVDKGRAPSEAGGQLTTV